MAKAKLGFETTNDTSKAEKSFDRITAAAKRSNAEIKRDGINAAEEIGKKNQESLKAMIGRFAPIAVALSVLFSIARKVGEAFSKMAENGKKLRETAEDIGVSAQTAARLKAQADAAGISAKEYAKSLDDLKSGATSIDEISAAWARAAKEAHGAKEANAAFADAMRKNFEDIALSKNIEKLEKFNDNLWRHVAGGMVSLVGGDSNAETTVEYGLAKGIRSGKGKDAVIRHAIQAQMWSPVEGTAMWEARYKELSELFDKRAAEIDSERQASDDRRVASVYDKLGGDAKLTIEALKRVGFGSLTEKEVIKAVDRARDREDQKTKDDRVIKVLMDENARREKEEQEDAAKEKARSEGIRKTAVNYAYAQGGGLLAGIHYGFLQSTKETIAADQLKQLTKQTASLSRMVDQLQQVNKTLSSD